MNLTGSDQPNILFITTDMQKLDTLGCYGNPIIRTPHIDKLATDGVRFTNAFVNNPVCMPSRASWVTGKVPSAHGVRWNAGGLRAKEMTVTKRLHDVGYEVAAIGKMHWGEAECDFGFDYWNLTDHGFPASPSATNYGKTLEKAGLNQVPNVKYSPEYKEYYGAVASPLPEDYHMDGFIANATLEYLEKRDPSKPFFCWCSFFGPHLPLDPAEPWDRLYAEAELPEPIWNLEEFENKPPEQRAFQQNKDRGNGFGDYRKITENPKKLQRFLAHYWSKISMIDAFVGRIVSYLEANHLKENTLIVFTSDHGDFGGNHRLLFKSAFLYDDLLRVPLIFSWPGKIRPSTQYALTEQIDISSTLLELAGLKPHAGMQGDSLMPLLNGELPKDWKNAVYAEAVDHRMIRTEKWKLVYYRGKPYGELYRIDEDQNELNNLYDDPTLLEVRERLMRLLVDRQVQLEARLHPSVPYIELDDPLFPGEPDRRVRLPYI